MAGTRETFRTDVTGCAPPEPDTADTDAVGNITPLVGSMTGYSKQVAINIGDAAISGQLRAFLNWVLAGSFGDAGYQRRKGMREPGIWCPYDNAEWAARHGMRRQHMYRLREKAVELGILFYEPDAEDPRHGMLRWNLAFEEWKPLDRTYRRQRYTRAGAGRKPGIPKSNGLRSPAEDESNGLRALASETVSNGLRSVGESVPNGLRSSASNRIKQVTHARSEAREEATRADALRKGTEESVTKETDAHASGAATSAGAVPQGVIATEIVLPKSDPPSSPRSSPASRRTPKLTGEVLEAHRAEQAYVSQVLNAYIQRLGASVKLANPGRERNAAHWFYTAKDGQPVPVEEIMDCYDITKRTSFWRTKPLSLMKLKEYWLEYQADPAEYRAANGGNNGTRTNSGGPAASSTGRTASPRKAEPVIPDPTADGEYAAFIRAKQAARAARTQGERGSHTPTS